MRHVHVYERNRESVCVCGGGWMVRWGGGGVGLILIVGIVRRSSRGEYGSSLQKLMSPDLFGRVGTVQELK